MRVYVELARRSFQRHLAYRQATVAGIFTNAVFGVLIASVYGALYRSRGGEADVAGFGLSEIFAFIWIGQSLLMVVAIWGWWEMAVSIQTGNVVADLIKPINYYGYWLSQDLGRAGCHVLTRFIPTFLLGLLLYDVATPQSVARWPLFAVSVALGVLVSFAFRFMMNAAAFWMTDIAGIRATALVATTFLSGMLVPISFFPPWLRTAVELLPFRTFLMVPIDVFLGHGSAARALGLQLFWAIALSGLALLVLRRAVRKVVIQGG
ncbi:MAG: viologen exporter family transport system permease protein [Thermomicrobiales bacterium]|nr:viologen exporter family transport system permease protein [Thermomicrobiales bacterium]